MAPRKRGGPAQPVGGNYSTRYYTGVSAAPKATAIIPEAVEDPAESPAGTASVEEESGAFHQLASEIETPADIDSPTLPAIAPPAIVPPAVVENADSGTVNAALSPMDEAVSASASLIGSVAGGIGLASIIGGGLVVVGLGAAIGAWYSVALANNYLTRRWGAGRSGAA